MILDASRGRELLRVTNDGASWAPVWSPKGDAIAFLHIEGQIVDLRMAVLGGNAPGLDGHRDQGPDRGLRPRRRVPARLVHPGERAAGPDAGADPGRHAEPVRQLERAGPVTGTYLERLAARSAATGTVLCLGLDPDPATLPDGFSRDLAGVERFATLVVEAAAPYAAAIKPNLAFFEAFGSAGMAALERIRARIPADVPVLVDAKRGDIGTTAARQAVALFDGLGADAVTVNPYLGAEAIAPLLERLDRFAYVLCRTSNPGAGELQDLGGRRGSRRRVPGRAAPPPGGPARRDLGARRDGRPGRRRHRAGRARGHPVDRARPRVPRPRRRRPGRRRGRGPRATASRARPRPAADPAAASW